LKEAELFRGRSEYSKNTRGSMKYPKHRILNGALLCFALAVLGTVACRRSKEVNPTAASSTVQLTLKLNQTVMGTTGWDYRHFITFDSVLSNSRSHIETPHSEQGDAVVKLLVGSEPRVSSRWCPDPIPLVLHTDPRFAGSQTYRGYQFYLDDLLPNPRQGAIASPESYTAKVRIVATGLQPFTLMQVQGDAFRLPGELVLKPVDYVK